MRTLPTLPTLPSIDLSKFDLPKFDLPKFDLSKLPKFELPKFEMPRVEQDVITVAREAAYATVGLGVLAIQQAQRGVVALGDQLRRYAK